MKKYRFKLESLLKYRKLSENRLQQELFLKINKLRQCENQLNLIQSEKDKYVEKFNHAQSSGIDGKDIFVYKNYLTNLNKQLQEQEIKTINAQNEVDDARKIYLEARKELEVVEKLKEIDVQRYLEEVKVIEQKALDEAASSQYNNQNRKDDNLESEEQ